MGKAKNVLADMPFPFVFGLMRRGNPGALLR
jgi:hypothetical protein